MSTPLSFGLIGAGWIGCFHAETLAHRLPNARLAAIADPEPEAAERLSAPRCYLDPLDLIADPTIDAVAICSPAASHADLVVAAAQAGKHVFCEKPMALTLDDADRADRRRAHRGGRPAGRLQPPLRPRFRRHARPDRRGRDRHTAAAAIADPRPRHLRRRRRPGEAVDDLQRDIDPRLRHAVLAQPGRPGHRGLRPGRCAGASAVRRPRVPRHLCGADPVRQRRFRDRRGQFPGGVRLRRSWRGVRLRRRAAGRARTRERRLASNTELFADAYVAQFAHFVECVRDRHRALGDRRRRARRTRDRSGRPPNPWRQPRPSC